MSCETNLRRILCLHRAWCRGKAWGVRAVLSRANLRHANLRHAVLSRADLTHADLTHANLWQADLSRANLTHSILTHADLTHANLWQADLNRANLTHANLSHSDLRHAVLSHSILSHSDLTHAVLTHANLTHANLTHANLRHTVLRHANLRHAVLSHSILSHSDLRHADLRGAKGIFLSPHNRGAYHGYILRCRKRACMGCREHSISEWLPMTREQVADMTYDGAEWYDEYWAEWATALKEALEPGDGQNNQQSFTSGKAYFMPHASDVAVLSDAVRLLRKAAEDETSYEVEIAGLLDNIARKFDALCRKRGFDEESNEGVHSV